MTTQELWAPSELDVYGFLQGMTICHLATIGPGGPYSATVAFSQTRDLELLIGTSYRSDKYANMVNHPAVSLVVTDELHRLTVQWRGVARLIEDDELAMYAEAHLAKLPGTRPFWGLPDERYFLLSPHWIKFSNCSMDPWGIKIFRY